MTGTPPWDRGDTEQVSMRVEPDSAAGEWALFKVVAIADPVVNAASGAGGNK